MAKGRDEALSTYWQKRRFNETPEPRGEVAAKGGRLYTIQKHAATRLHYDLRLELDGVLKSWAVTKGPSYDPADKRLAVRTEDHPLDYATFEGRIPEGNYGAGTVLLWDRGTWEPLDDPREGLEKGKLAFRLNGERLRGRWALVRFKGKDSSKRENWLLIKERDEAVDPERDVTADETASVASGREMEAIAAAPEAVWRSDRSEAADPAPAKGRKSRAKPAAQALPAFVSPALATLVDHLPSGDDWVYEIKFDGYRTLAAVSGDEVRLHTRNGLDWTHRYPSLVRALAKLDLDGALLDGEVVVVDKAGRTDFGALQRALKGEGGTLSYFLFDLLQIAGEDLRKQPLVERKARLEALLTGLGREGPLFYSGHLDRGADQMLERLCGEDFEGVIAKRANSPYRSGRGRSWLKIKCERTQEFVVVGWASSTRDRPFSSLLLGVEEEGGLRYAGKVGSGYSEEELASLSARLRKLARKTAPVEGEVPADARRGAHWVRPELVAQVQFAEFTRDGLVRQGRFLGLREDKPARDVVRERPEPVEEAEKMAASESAGTVAGVRLTHPERVLYPQQGVTKRSLAEYMVLAAPRMLPQVSRRLVSLVRCPEGRAKQCFFQKHGGAGLPAQFQRLPVREKGDKQNDYLYVDSVEALVAAVQMGVLELHIWGSHIDRVEQPDRIVFDLDPDPTVDFAAVKAAAVRMRDALDALGLQSVPLLTGGKGVHVVVPIARRYEWPTVKAFSGALAHRFADDDPGRFVATITKAKRKGRIFIDFFRNDRGSTAIAPYSPRAREGAPLAWPVSWEELAETESAASVSVPDAAARLREADPWVGYDDLRQSLKVSALRALGVEGA